VLYNKNNS